MAAADAAAAFAMTRAVAGSEVARLRERRPSAADPAEGRRRAMEAADMTREARLRHRYEMAHKQPLRSAIRGLLALAKSGADLPEELETEAGGLWGRCQGPIRRESVPDTGPPRTLSPRP